MQLTPREALLQFGHVLQEELFPHLEAAVGQLSTQLELLAAVVCLVPLGRLLSAGRAGTSALSRTYLPVLSKSDPGILS
jgi:hypothetical protein